MINDNPTVLHTIDTTGPGGAETVFLDLAENLTLKNYETLAVIKGAGWVEDQLKMRRIPYMVIKPEGFLSLGYYWRLYRLIRQRRVKLIQAHLLGSALTYSLISMLTRTPVVATLHGQVDVNPNERWIYLKNRILRIGIDRLVTVSERLASYITNRKLFDSERISVIHNGVQPEKYRRNNSHDLRDQLGLNEESVIIGCLGNVRPAKAYDILVSASRYVINKNSKVHFVIAGHQKPALMENLNEQISTLNVRGHFHFIGFYSDTSSFLGQLDLFCLSSSTEGFSIATVEALATGLPVVATRCGGPEEILTHGKTGWLVPSGDPSALADGLLFVLENNELRARLGADGMEYAKTTFAMNRVLKKYESLYRDLLGAELTPD